jgi:2-polyprenyl-3-methyl-5-hydroxy-6-metoxy-1,4-benzoquinol methylase
MLQYWHMLLGFYRLHNLSVIQEIFRRFDAGRSEEIVQEISPNLHTFEKILDLGAGLCTIVHLLKKKDFSVTPLDVCDRSVYPSIRPIIYDGKKIPFKNNAFDTVLLITVLHHTPHPDLILKEASRVAKKIIIMEDVYSNPFQKYLTFFMDSVTNFEFFGHPHTNKSDRMWREIFHDLNLTVQTVREHTFWIFFTSKTYVVVKR